MTVTYEDIIPSLIENTTMVKGLVDGVHNNYRITPFDGYVLHDNARDMPEYDPVTMMPTGNVVLGYTRGAASCRYNYDFEANPREFYAVPESEVPDPENQNFGDNNEV